LTDNHDFQLLPSGHSLLMAYDWQPVRMDTIVPGGDSSAYVIGLIVQELDESKNVIFQWRSWDHFQITDATEDIDLTKATIDYVHGNAIEVDYDGHLLISSRHLDEITKINRQTGEIIWRFGGKKSRNNQFLFINDTITFSHQHDIRRLPNGNITLFDNGNLHVPQISRSREYQIDEVNKIANLIWSYNSDPEKYSIAMGSTQRLSNHNTLIGWGWFSTGYLAVSEVAADGLVKFELSLPDTFVNYRAFRFPWKTNLFVTNRDSIFFESVSVGDSASIIVAINNNSSNPINITGFYSKNSDYIVEKPIPFSLSPFGSDSIEIKFKPSKEGYFKDTLHIRSDTDFSRIAQLMILKGRTDSTFSDVENEVIVGDYKLEQNYPNPFNPSTKIEFYLTERELVSLTVYDILGNKIKTLVQEELPAGKYSVEFYAGELSSGIYFCKLSAGKFRNVKKMLLLK
ncbi:MAG: aryl-sulfate sulfotransferase, partial [Candidatus Kariarchaeaceae archaeon]